MHTRRVLADGTVATHDFQIREARDSNGLFLQETQAEIAAGSGRPPLVIVSVFDPEARTLLTWTNANKTGTLTHLPSPGLRLIGPFLKTPGKTKQIAPAEPQIIGHRMIHGMLTTGRRTESVIAAGKIGNSEATAIKHEWWRDDDLRITVLDTSSDPQHGERTTELIEIKRVEPDPARFHMPAGYTVKEANKPMTAPSLVSGGQPSLDLEHVPALSHEEALLKLSSNDVQERNVGAAALVKEGQSSDDAARKDEIAYRLARANVGLNEARQLAEAAVQKAETASAAASGQNKATREDFTRDMTLGRYWDTLGYIHSRLGDTALAKEYIQCAFELDPQAYYGSHLGRLLEEAGDTQEAVRTYREALNSPGGEDMKRTLRERLQAITGAADAQVVNSGERPLADAAISQQGSAFFDLVYAGSKKSPAVLFVSGTDALKSLAPILAKADAETFALPDNGPEVVIRRMEVICKNSPGAGPACHTRSLGAHQARMLFGP